MEQRGKAIVDTETRGEWKIVSRRKTRRVSLGRAPPPSSTCWVPATSYAAAVSSFRPPSASMSSRPTASKSLATESADILAYVDHLRRSGRCFNCCGRGHLGYQCRAKPVCFVCKGSGHKSKKCPTRKTSKQAPGRSCEQVVADVLPKTEIKNKDKGLMQDLADDYMLRSRPESINTFLPPAESTLNRAGYLRERCIVVTVLGHLEENADVAGFLASCFRDEASHRRQWCQRRLPDGRLLVTTPSGCKSYYKFTLIRRKHFCWGRATLRVADWVEEGVHSYVPPPELIIGLELKGLPMVFWNDEALAALVSSFGMAEYGCGLARCE